MGECRRRVDKVLDPGFLVDLPEWSPSMEIEWRRRRELHQVIDHMEDDLAARHKVGQA